MAQRTTKSGPTVNTSKKCQCENRDVISTYINDFKTEEEKENSNDEPCGAKKPLSNVLQIDGATRYNVYLEKAKGCHIEDTCIYSNCQIVYSHLQEPSTNTDGLLLKCVERLKLQHSTRNVHMSSLLWYDENRDFSLEDYFISLQIDEDDLTGKFKKRKNIELQELFASPQNKTLSKRILITGKPGFGKTTLVKKLAYDWATLKHPHYLSNFDLVVTVFLRKLGSTSIPEILQQILLSNSKELLHALETTKLDILLLLDGFDELEETHHVLEFIRGDNKQCAYSAKITVLLTSRPQAVETVRMEFQRRLTIIGFSTENQIKYINLALGRSLAFVSKFSSRLQNDSFLSQLAKCPLMLHVLCCLHHDIDLVRVRRVTDLYIEIFSLIIRRYVQKYGDHSSLRSGKYLPGEPLLAKFGAVAFMYLCKRINAINDHELKKVLSDDEYEVIKRLDFLVGSQVFSKNGQTKMEFEVLHGTFTEFLSALYLAVNYEQLEVLERKNTSVDIHGIRHHSKDIEIALVDHETFLLCYFGLTSERSVLSRSLKFPVQLSTGKNVSLLSQLKNEISEGLWKEFAAIIKFLDFNCGKDSIIDLEKMLKEAFLEELVLHFTSQCTLTDIKNILTASEVCQTLKSIFIYPVTHAYMRLVNGLQAVIFYVDLGLSMDAIIQFFSTNNRADLSLRLVGETQYVHDVTKKRSSYFDIQESNFIGLLVYDSSKNSDNVFEETSSFRFELCMDKILIRMRFRSCVYRFGDRHLKMEKKVVFFVTRDQYLFLSNHPVLSVFTKKGKVLISERRLSLKHVPKQQ